MPPFVSANVPSDPNQALDTAVDAINANLAANGYPGWTANDATLAVIVISTFAQLLVDAAQVSASVLPAVWRAFGTQFLGVLYQNGASATVQTTWTFTSPAPAGGYTIDAGTTVIVGGYAFYVQTAYTSNVGDTTAVITLVAAQAGTLYNALGGINAPAALNDQIDWVQSIVTQGLTSGGQDQETDAAYQDRLVGAVALQAPRPVVASDFAGMVLSDIAEQATGVAVGRATSLDGYYPDGRLLSTGGATSPTVISCATTNGSAAVTYTPLNGQVPEPGATVTGTGIPANTTVAAAPAPTETTFTLSNAATATATNSLTVSALSGYGPTHLTCSASLSNGSANVTVVTPPYAGAVPDVGARVRGTGIPLGATVAASPAPTATSFALSLPATANETAETVTISSWTSVGAANTTAVTDANGDALSAAEMDALAAWLQKYRPQNWLANLAAPSYNTTYSTVVIHCLPGYNPAAAAAAVQQALLAWLSPANWGNPGVSGTNGWLNSGAGFNVARINKAIEVAGSVTGVDYIVSLTLGFGPNPTGTTDITMSGPFPLPQSSASTIAVTAQ